MAVSTPTLAVTRHSTGHMVKLDVSGATGGATVTVNRYVGSANGAKAWVRGAYNASLTSGAATLLDTEPPQGVILVYQAVAADSAGGTATSTAITLSGTVSLGSDWLFDMVSTMNGYAVNVAEFGQVTYPLRQETVAVIGRRAPLIVTDVRELGKFDLTLVTFTQEDAESIRGSIYRSSILALSPSTSDYGFTGPIYFTPLDVTEARMSTLGRVAARKFTLSCQQVEPPTTIAVLTGVSASSLWATYTTPSAGKVTGLRGLGWRSTATFAETP